MKNLISKSKFLLKSTLLALALLFVNAVTTHAQTVYVQLGFTPGSWSPTYTGYSTHVLFWQDAEATIPASDPYVNLNIKYVSRTNCGTKYDQNFTGSAAQIEGDAFGQAYWAEDYDYITHETTTTTAWYELRPGTGYQIANEPYLLGGPADYCP
ncbi:hypothetical protein ABIE26_002668 [Pedobacter africanus]|uniref:Uncharacterized protein n=1 Tax=Pedobacter africanus TaxID=151894 RepID=A0ACC6KX36_9SPHI|nr:hypothetical protein [Pedobacter africanus]MDR6783943.1 hypothetical protein [Pedobacter africanus]